MNQSLSFTLLKGKKKFLKLKNRLIQQLRNSLSELIKNKIEKNYSQYIDFLLKKISDIKKTIDKPQEIEIIFNPQDYNYFMQNYGKIQDMFKNPIEINKDNVEFLGGFKISLVGGNISYDYSIDNLINIKSSFIQMEIAKVVNDLEIRQIEKNFNTFIQNQKSKIAEHIRKYDQIQF